MLAVDFIKSLLSKKINIDKSKINKWLKFINELKLKYPILSGNYINKKIVDPYFF